MKDLNSLLDLSSIQSKKKGGDEEEGKFASVLFSQTKECRDLVLSAYRFEGITAPSVIPNEDKEIIDFMARIRVDVVLVELNLSEHVAEDAERISRLLPNNLSVIIIGSEDAISTIRSLKDMGFYYVFWPISKEEFIEFVNSVHDNQERNKKIGQGRAAKQIAVIGTKGGVGTTFLTSEIAYVMSRKQKSNSVIIDCDYVSGDLDILLGLKNFQKHVVNSSSTDLTGDYSLGESFSKKIDSKLSLLAIESEDIPPLELYEYTSELAKQLNPTTNFIFYDLSASISFKLDMQKQMQNWDVIVLVVEPLISSIREATKYLKAFQADKENVHTRMLTVFNHPRSDNGLLVSRADAEGYLARPFDAVIPYAPKLVELFIQGQHISDKKTSIGKRIEDLVSDILGEPQKVKKGLFANLFSRGKS